jgi:hypothetical protein
MPHLDPLGREICRRQILPQRSLVSGEPFEYRVTPRPRRIVRHHDRGMIGLGIVFRRPDESFGSCVGERTQKGGIHDAEHRSVLLTPFPI